MNAKNEKNDEEKINDKTECFISYIKEGYSKEELSKNGLVAFLNSIPSNKKAEILSILFNVSLECKNLYLAESIFLPIKNLKLDSDKNTFLKIVSEEHLVNINETLAEAIYEYIKKVNTSKVDKTKFNKVKEILMYKIKKKNKENTFDKKEENKNSATKKKVKTKSSQELKQKLRLNNSLNDYSTTEINKVDSAVNSLTDKSNEEDPFSLIYKLLSNVKDTNKNLIDRINKNEKLILNKEEIIKTKKEENKNLIEENKIYKNEIEELKNQLEDLNKKMEQLHIDYDMLLNNKEKEINVLNVKLEEAMKANADLQNSKDISKQAFIAQISQKLQIRYKKCQESKKETKEFVENQMDNLFDDLKSFGIKFDDCGEK
ncbi:MAG: hypothetical protein IJZ59_00565 [Alphaproteobacteria bacterium]|nr:hypothetical protein [Alphaproteobacteria bacterium]